MLDERQGGEALRGVARVGVVEQQDRPAAVRLEEHVADQALRAQFGDPAALRRQVRGDVLAGQVTDDQNLHQMPSFAVMGCAVTAAFATSTSDMSTMRTTVASSSTATAMPSPMTRSTRRSPSTNAAKTQIMMAAAEVMTRPVEASPLLTAAEFPAPPAHSSLIFEMRNTW